MTNPSPRRVIPLKLERSLALSAAERKAVVEACERGKALPGGLLPILHAVQEALGFVPSDAVHLIAHELNLSRAEVHGVVSFYHYFRTERGGRHVVHVCRAEACQSLGAAALEAHAKKSLGLPKGRFKCECATEFISGRRPVTFRHGNDSEVGAGVDVSWVNLQNGQVRMRRNIELIISQCFCCLLCILPYLR